ncbi:MAG: NUDIX hydrolase [Candidatus Phaeomarinobacter sp.]
MTSCRSKAPPERSSTTQAAPSPRTAVSVAVMQADKVLLVLREREGREALWAFPGGKVEVGETLQQAAKRELIEETGIKADISKVLGAYSIVAQSIVYHLTVFTAAYLDGVAVAGDDAADVRWVTPQDAQSLPLAEHMADALGKL